MNDWKEFSFESVMGLGRLAASSHCTRMVTSDVDVLVRVIAVVPPIGTLTSMSVRLSPVADCVLMITRVFSMLEIRLDGLVSDDGNLHNCSVL